jgi:ABC-type lipoprotein export system ATPase subunit
MEAPVIRMAGVGHSYGTGTLRTQVLFDVTAEVHAGEVVLLTGPSGSGKTTLLTLVGCLRALQQGSVVVLGQELLGASETARERWVARGTPPPVGSSSSTTCCARSRCCRT